ncbi:MAG: hypothetical protein M9921_09455 [Fimbriimonadaceae bacterium]|nr:hypothetical protein [Chthonomonadaceae bacterium]MCO5297069.1 hypothetical protein [Fimbriimonadaceae bacterium]
MAIPDDARRSIEVEECLVQFSGFVQKGTNYHVVLDSSAVPRSLKIFSSRRRDLVGSIEECAWQVVGNRVHVKMDLTRRAASKLATEGVPPKVLQACFKEVLKLDPSTTTWDFEYSGLGALPIDSKVDGKDVRCHCVWIQSWPVRIGWDANVGLGEDGRVLFVNRGM